MIRPDKVEKINPAVVFEHLGSCPDAGRVVCQLGDTAQIASQIVGDDRLFPMLGSMGMVLPFSLGLALGNRGRVTAVEGDGGLLMCLGVLSTIATAGPPNLLCVILDNDGYQTTGGQPTGLKGTHGLEAIFTAMGFDHVRTATSDNLEEVLQWGCQPGLRAIIVPTHAPVPPLVVTAFDPPDLTRAFCSAAGGHSGWHRLAGYKTLHGDRS